MSNQTSYQAKIYPQGKPNPTLKYADKNRANLGICFSGGGSRALTGFEVQWNENVR